MDEGIWHPAPVHAEPKETRLFRLLSYEPHSHVVCTRAASSYLIYSTLDCTILYYIAIDRIYV
jgi:hypothetical protein